MVKHGILTLLACATLTLAQENYSTWSSYKSITINTKGANLGNGLGKYPLLVRLTSANSDVFSAAAANGADIRFTKANGTTRLPHQRERWDAVNKVAEFWVQVDTINAGDSTQSIRMYWGKSGAADSSSGASVFNTTNGFGAVWHLGDSTAANPRPNQVSGGPAATLKNWTSGGPVSGIVGLADSLGAGGVCDSITKPGMPYIDLNAARTSYGPYNTLSAGTGFTWSAWYFDSTGTSDAGARLLVAAADSTVVSAAGRLIIFRPNADNRTFTTRWGTNGSPVSTDPKVTLQGRTWQYLTITKAPGNVGVNFYTNGAFDGTGSALTSSTDANRPYVEVGRDACASGSTTDNYLSGKVDEMQLSNTVRDSNWVKLNFQTQCNATVAACPSVSPVVLGITQSNIPGAENYATWSHHRQIGINTNPGSFGGANLTAPVAKFPLLVRLTPAQADVFAQAAANGADIRFTKADGVTRLPHQRERWDATNKLAEFWVLVDSVKANSQSNVIQMYWGKSGAADSSSGTQVFATANHFQAVFHLNENAGDTAQDATGKFRGVPIGTAPTNVAGSVPRQFISGASKNFGGNGTDITTGGAYRLVTAAGKNTDSSMDFVGTTATFTVSAWVDITSFPTSNALRPGIVTKAGTSSTTNTNLQWHLRATEHNSGSFSFLRVSEDPSMGFIVTRPDAAGVWSYVSYSANAAATNFGVYNAVGGATVINPTADAGTHQDVDVVIGAFAGGTGTATGTNFFNGNLDEVVISDTGRSPDWSALSYATQRPDTANAVIVGPTDGMVSFPTAIGQQAVSHSGTGFSAFSSGNGVVFRLPQTQSAVRVSVMDIWGRTVWSQSAQSGTSELTWNGKTQGRATATGIYVVRLTAGANNARVLGEAKIALTP